MHRAKAQGSNLHRPKVLAPQSGSAPASSGRDFSDSIVLIGSPRALCVSGLSLVTMLCLYSRGSWFNLHNHSGVGMFV